MFVQPFAPVVQLTPIDHPLTSEETGDHFQPPLESARSCCSRRLFSLPKIPTSAPASPNALLLLHLCES